MLKRWLIYLASVIFGLALVGVLLCLIGPLLFGHDLHWAPYRHWRP